jgi:hypothetical protein
MNLSEKAVGEYNNDVSDKETTDITTSIGDVKVSGVDLLQPRKEDQLMKPTSSVIDITTFSIGSPGNVDEKDAVPFRLVEDGVVSCISNIPIEASNVEMSTVVPEISTEDLSWLTMYDSMRIKYIQRARDLIQKVIDNNVEEEDFQNNPLHVGVICTNEMNSSENGKVAEFKDAWLRELSVIVQGR